MNWRCVPETDEADEPGICAADGRDLLDARGAVLWREAPAAAIRNLELLWPLLDITTTLDPNLIVGVPVRVEFLERCAADEEQGEPDLRGETAGARD